MRTSWIIYQIMTFLEPIREQRLQGHQVNGISKRDQLFQERPDHPQREEEVAPYRQVRRQSPKAHVGEHVPQPGAQTEKELPPPDAGDWSTSVLGQRRAAAPGDQPKAHSRTLCPWRCKSRTSCLAGGTENSPPPRTQTTPLGFPGRGRNVVSCPWGRNRTP